MSAANQPLRVREVMTREVVTAYPDDTIKVALELFVENRVSALPIVDGHQRCIGILSTTDLVDRECEHEYEFSQMNSADPYTRKWLQAKLDAEMSDQQIKDIMTDGVCSVSAEATIQDAAAEMVRSRVHHLPVVGDNDKVVGIVSTMDLLAGFVESTAVAK